MSVYMGGTRGLCVLSSVGDVLEISVVIDVGGVCMCLAQGLAEGVEGEWVRGLGLGFTNPGRTGEKWDMCVFCLRWCGRLGPGSGRVMWC